MKKLAMVGCGGIGAYHLEHFLAYKDVSLAGFCDVTLSRAEAFAAKAGRGAKAFDDFHRMYDAVKPDMVFICVPPYSHGEIEFETIQRGIPFFVEKPLALDQDLARELLSLVKQSGVVAASGFQCRYDNINDAAAKYLAKNKPVAVQASRVGGVPEVNWWRNKFISGGQLVEQTIHQMDMLRYLLKEEPVTVYSVANRGRIPREEWPGYYTDDVSTTVVTFESGLACTMITGCFAKNAVSWESKMTFGARESRMDYVLCESVTVYSEEAKRRGGKGGKGGDGKGGDGKGGDGKGASVVKGDGVMDNHPVLREDVTRSTVDFGAICDRTFVDAAISGDAKKIRSPYEDAYKSVIFTLACNESMKTGQPVKVRY